MSEKLTRVYKKMDAQEIKSHLFIYGDLSASCANCSKVDLKIDVQKCPECQTEFKYVAFRNVRSHLPKMVKLFAERPSLTIVDFDDYQRNLSASKAEDFLR